MPVTGTPNPDQSNGQSRLDREVDEILRQSETSNPLPKAPRAKPKPIRAAVRPTSFQDRLPEPVRRAAHVPILQALVLAIAAAIVRDISPFIAAALCTLAVASIVWPVIAHYRRPQSPPEASMWRGQAIDLNPTPSTPNPIDAIRQWWRNRQ